MRVTPIKHLRQPHEGHAHHPVLLCNQNNAFRSLGCNTNLCSRPLMKAATTAEPSSDHDFFFFFPMLGKRFFTAALTFFCSAGVPFCATRARALRA
jgi:hypothetical protein